MSLLFVVIQSCSANDKELVTMKFSPHELAEQLILELDNKNISYKHDDNDNLSFNKSDMDTIMSLSKEIMQKILPKERSFSPASEALLACYINEFDSRNVLYEIKTVDNKKWIILKNEHFDKYYSLCSSFQ